MRSRVTVWLLAAAALVLLRTGIVEIRQESAVMQGQRPLVLEGVDPAALFYTEIPLALAAEKEVRRRLDALRPRQRQGVVPCSDPP